MGDADRLYKMAEKLNQAAESEAWQDRCPEDYGIIRKLFKEFK